MTPQDAPKSLQEMATEYADEAPEQDTWAQRYDGFLSGYDSGHADGRKEGEAAGFRRAIALLRSEAGDLQSIQMFKERTDNVGPHYELLRT